MRIKKVGRNFKVDIVVTVLLVFFGFFSRQIFIGSMGNSFTGMMLLFTQLMGFINLAELGIGVAAASILYLPLSKSDESAINSIYATLTAIYKKIALLVIFIGVVLGIIIFLYIDTVKSINNAYLYWALYVLNTAISYFYADKIILITADQKYSTVRAIQGGIKILTVFLQILVIFYLKNFYLYLLIETFFVFIQAILFNLIIKRNYQYIKPSEDKNIELLPKIKQMFFHKLGGVLVFNIDYILISKFLTLTYVTVYSSYIMIFQAVTMLMNIAVNSLTASVGNYFIEKRNEILPLWKNLYTVFFLIATIVCSVIYLSIDGFISNWIGSQYILPKSILLALLFNVFIGIVRLPTDILKNASGIFNDIHLPILEGITNLVISFILIQHLGLIGVVIGTVISNIIFIVLAKPIYLINSMMSLGFSSYLNLIKVGVVYSIISFVVIYFSSKTIMAYLDFSTWFYWLMSTSLLTLLLLIVATTIFLIDANFRYFTKKTVRAFV